MARERAMVWDLDTFFPGGSESPAFAEFMAATERLTERLLGELKEHAKGKTDPERLTEWNAALQRIQPRLREADSFVGCLTAERVSDRRAAAWTEKVQTLSARCRQALDLFDALLAAMPDDEWQAWIADGDAAEIAFVLNERREEAKDKLPPALEALAGELAIDGYHGWGEHYGTIVSRIGIPWEENGRSVVLSAGQAVNKMEDADPAVRARMKAE